MISKQFIYEEVLPLVKEKGRMVEYYLIKSLFENKDIELMKELKKFQNPDGGFGHALEADIRMPGSNVASTDVAIKYLDAVSDQKLKETTIKEIVEYYESIYNKELERFVMVTEEVDNYPHAIWWNYKDILKNFPFGNPDPEVIGFLYENRRYLKKLNYVKLINKVVDFINSDAFLDGGMHTLMSVMMFYKRVDDDIKNLIHDRIHLVVRKEIEAGLGKWDDYSLEPYKVYVIEPHFINTHLEALGENLTLCIKKINSLAVEPNWKWYQYNEEFEKAKYDWIGYMYYGMIKALRLQRII